MTAVSRCAVKSVSFKCGTFYPCKHLSENHPSRVV